MKVHDLSSATKLFQIVKQSNLLMRARGLFFIIDIFLCFFMGNPKKKQASKKRILIPCFSGMGDSVLFFRMARKLEILFPKDSYELVWICNDVHGDLFKQFFDFVLPLPLYKMSFNLWARYQILKFLHQESYDMVLDPSGCCDFTPNIFITRSVTAPVKIGLCPGILDCGSKKPHYPQWLRKMVYTDVVEVDDSIRHLSGIINKFFETAAKRSIEITPDNSAFIQKKIEGLPVEYYVLCPAGSHVRQKWPVERYAELIDRLYKRCKKTVVLVGSAGDQEVCSQIQASIGDDVPLLNLANKTTFQELTWILGHAEFVVTIDTGTYHLAIAVNAETFVIAHRALFHLYIKYDPLPPNVHIICEKNPECMDCAHSCRYGGTGPYPCVSAITVDEVEEKIAEQFSGNSRL